METTEHTLQKGFVRSDMHLLLCEENVWLNWIKIMRQYARGQLPNTKGETQSESAEQGSKIPTLKGGRIQQASGTVTLGPTLFRCISGLENHEVITLQRAILDGSILLKKSKHTIHKVDMEEMAWQLKTDRVLKQVIIGYFFDLTRDMLTWEEVCTQYKLGDYEYKQMRSYSHSYVKDYLNRAKKSPSLPTSMVTLLNHLYRAAKGIVSQQESIPWKIRGVGFDISKITTFCSAEHVPFQLAILDLHGTKDPLSIEYFSGLITALNMLNSQFEYIVVCFIDFVNIGKLVEGVSSQATKLHYEVGVIDTKRKDAWTAGATEIASVALFISKVNTFEVIDKVLSNKVLISGSSGGKGYFLKRGFIDGLITGFCPEQSYVLDIYCGGHVLEQSLLNKRRCIALCKDEFEAMEIESQCSSLMESDASLQEWCGAHVALQKQTIQLDEEDKENLDNIDVDDQPSGDDEADDEGDEGETRDDEETQKDEKDDEDAQKDDEGTQKDEQDDEGDGGKDVGDGSKAQVVGAEAEDGNEGIPTNNGQDDIQNVGSNIEEQKECEVDTAVNVEEGDVAKNLEDTAYKGNAYEGLNATEDVYVINDDMAREARDDEESGYACRALGPSSSKAVQGRKKIKLV